MGGRTNAMPPLLGDLLVLTKIDTFFSDRMMRRMSSDITVMRGVMGAPVSVPPCISCLLVSISVALRGVFPANSLCLKSESLDDFPAGLMISITAGHYQIHCPHPPPFTFCIADKLMMVIIAWCSHVYFAQMSELIRHSAVCMFHDVYFFVYPFLLYLYPSCNDYFFLSAHGDMLSSFYVL